MKTFKLISVIFVIQFCFSLAVKAQSGAGSKDSLYLSDLVSIALEQNFDIKIAKKNAVIAENNVALGNADYLPSISLNGGYEYSIQDTDIEFASPEQPPINQENAATETANASVDLEYNLFSGGARKYTYSSLVELNEQEKLNMRASMEEVVLNVLLQFLDYSNQYYTYELDMKALEISNRRYSKAAENKKYGIFTELELLNAEVDLRNDSTAMLQSKLAMIKAEKQILNNLGINPDSSLRISPRFEIESNIELGKLKERAFSRNAQFLLSESRIRSSELELKQTKSNWLPRLDLSAAYRFNSQDNEASFITQQNTNGFNGGLQLSYTIFNGFNRRRQEQNQRIQLETAEQNKAKVMNNLQLNIINSYQEYKTALELSDLAERNIKAARQNYNRSETAFGTGQIDGIQLREAQLNLLNSLYLLRSQRIQAKIAEANLYFYSGSLVE